MKVKSESEVAHQEALVAGKIKETEFFPHASRKKAALQDKPAKMFVDFWPTELQDYKFVLC